MKTQLKSSLNSLFKMTFLAVIFLTFSCSQENITDLSQENLKSEQAKGKKANNKSVLKTLVKGAALNAANGLDVGPNGNLYIASVNGQEIVEMNKNSGKIINRFGPESGVFGPDDLVFGPDGTLYWTDILTGYVGRMTPDGQILGYQFVAPGVNPIRFSEDGRLFVGLDFLGDGLYELDPQFDFANDANPRQIISCPDKFGLGFFNSFDTRWEDGRTWLYGPLFALNVVIAIDVDSFDDTEFPADLSGLFASLGTGQIRIVAGQLNPPSFSSDLFNPAAAKFGPEGLLYVLDQAGKVWKVNADEEDEKTLFTTLQPGLDNMTFDKDGTLYMTNNDEGWVAEIFPNGQIRYISPGGMILPQGLAVMAGPNNQDMLFEADLFRLRKFNGTSGRQEEIYKGFLINTPTFDLPILPMNISAAGDKLVVSSWFSEAVQLWDISTNPATVEVAHDMPVPIDAVQIGDDIIVSDFGLGGVVNASQENAVIKDLDAASGLATDGETLWAADLGILPGTGKIWQIEFDPPNETIVAEGLDGPEGLALDNQGRLLVVEAGASRLSRIDLSTGDVTVLVEGLDLFGPGLGVPPTWGFDGVAVGPSGDIYVSGAGATVIYKVKDKN